MTRAVAGSASGNPARWVVPALAALVSALAVAGDQIQGTGPGGHCDPPALPPAPAATGSLSIPDVPLLNQDGEKVRFYSDLVRGKVVAINFVFTTCTTICPPMGANFSRLQRLLQDRAVNDAHLISVSVDPAVDTPRRLKDWAAKFGALPGWTLVTGAKPDVDRLLKALKVFTPDKTDHSPIVLVGDDARGEWTRVWGLAPPSDLARTIESISGAAGAASMDRSENGE